MRAVLYARVSSEEQVEGYSIDAQRRAFQKLVADRQWEAYREYIDEGKSARTDNIDKRPAFKEMMEDALARKFDVKEYKETQLQLRQLSPIDSGGDELRRLAGFLASVADAWRLASQEQRNKLARVLFDEIRLDNGGKVVAVKPRPELEPFFRLSYECHARDIGCDPGGLRGPMCNTQPTVWRRFAPISANFRYLAGAYLRISGLS